MTCALNGELAENMTYLSKYFFQKGPCEFAMNHLAH
jgi:hypothetical protein